MQITQVHSYRAIIRRGEFDPDYPEAGQEIIGLKAPNAQVAMQSAHEVTGAKVVVVYRQKRGAKC